MKCCAASGKSASSANTAIFPCRESHSEQGPLKGTLLTRLNYSDVKAGQTCKIATYKVVKFTVVGWEGLFNLFKKEEPGLYL